MTTFSDTRFVYRDFFPRLDNTYIPSDLDMWNIVPNPCVSLFNKAMAVEKCKTLSSEEDWSKFTAAQNDFEEEELISSPAVILWVRARVQLMRATRNMQDVHLELVHHG